MSNEYRLLLAFAVRLKNDIIAHLHVCQRAAELKSLNIFYLYSKFCFKWNNEQ